jgi:hypothetical protein
MCRNRQLLQTHVTRWHSGTVARKSLSNKHLAVCHVPAELAQWRRHGPRQVAKIAMCSDGMTMECGIEFVSPLPKAGSSQLYARNCRKPRSTK